MTTRSLWARVERLEKRRRPADKFAIDPRIAIAVRNDRHRLYHLDGTGNELEADRLHMRIRDACKAFNCPEDYGWREAHADREREHHYFSTMRCPPHRTEQEKAEEGQAIVRLAAWERTLEYQRRREIRALRINKAAYQETGEFTSWEQARYDDLLARCPDALMEPDEGVEALWINFLKTSRFGPRVNVYPKGGYGTDDPFEWYSVLEPSGPSAA